MTCAVDQVVADAFRESWGQIVATLIGSTGDWDLAEECAQDAFTAALEAWPRQGIPTVPGAWLTSVARNRAIDVLRRRQSGAAKLRELVVNSPPPRTWSPWSQMTPTMLQSAGCGMIGCD
jgi:RNA polymerase sigma-70 factor (ECF subfamily)